MTSKMRQIALAMAMLSCGVGAQLSRERSLIKKDKPTPNGCQKYSYEDGFSTVAISQKSADKKHEKWMLKTD